MNVSLVDVLWLTLCAGLVLLMQAGFLCREAGLAWSRTGSGVALRRLAGLSLALALFWAVGFGLMFGASYSGWFGGDRFFPNIAESRPWPAAFFLFQAALCATACAIISGAVADRVRVGVYLIAVALTAALIYPVFGHWVWSGLDAAARPGWLAARGFVDFAGATVIHTVGGAVALAAALVLGPREGRFGPGRLSRPLPPTDSTLAMLGTLLLFVGWLGLNGGSTLGASVRVSGVVANTLLGGVAGTLATLAAGAALKRRADLALISNGALAGLVAVSGAAHAISSAQAFAVGLAGGLIMLLAERLLERLRVDDSVGAIPVHLGAGAWGTLAVGLFGDADRLGTNLGRLAQLGAQFGGLLSCLVWAFGLSFAILTLLNRFYRLRLRPDGSQPVAPGPGPAVEPPQNPANGSSDHAEQLNWKALLTQPCVLVIDDDLYDRDLLVRVLSREGFRVLTATGGEEGLKRARELRPDAITLDALMPDPDGWAVLSALKEDPELAQTPVIMLTTNGEPRASLELGAADTLNKPLNPAGVVAALRKHLAAPGSVSA
jgi:Amt family ammonium transporter